MLQALFGGVFLAYLLIKLWVIVKWCLILFAAFVAFIVAWAMIAPTPQDRNRRR